MRLAVRLSIVFVLAAAASAATRPEAAAQNTSDLSIRGVVLDASHAAIAGARVEASTTSDPQPIATITDQAGGFMLSVKPGRYNLHITSIGFAALDESVTATSATAAPTEFVLQVPGVREAVTVTAPSGYQVPTIRTATKTPTPLLDVPQAVTVVTSTLIKDQMMMSVGDVMRYVPGVMVHQGENNRDQVIMRGNSSSADFFVDGVRDDVQYDRDLYNLERIEALKGPNAMIFGRGGAGGVVNRVSKLAAFGATREVSVQGGMFDNRRVTAGINQPLTEKVALRLDGMFEDSNSFRNFVSLERAGVTPTATIRPDANTTMTLRYEYPRTRARPIVASRRFKVALPTSTVTRFMGTPTSATCEPWSTWRPAPSSIAPGVSRFATARMLGNYDRFYQNFVPGAASATGAQVALTSYNNATNRTNLFNQTDVTTVGSFGRLRHTLLAGAEFGRQLTDNFRNTGFFNDTATSILVPFNNPTIATPVTFRQNATDADNHLTTNVAAVYAQDQIDVSRHVQVLTGLRSRPLRSHLPQRSQRRHAVTTGQSRVAARGRHLQAHHADVHLHQLQRVVPAELGRSVFIAHEHHRAGQARTVSELRSRGQMGCKTDPVGDDGGVSPEPGRTRARRTRTILLVSCRQAASAPTAMSSGSTAT